MRMRRTAAHVGDGGEVDDGRGAPDTRGTGALCRAVAARFCPPGDADFNDYCQEALIGAWQGLCSYDPAKSLDPRGFALRCARREVMNALTVRERKREECVLDAPVRDCGDGWDRW